jgi:citrate synthase
MYCSMLTRSYMRVWFGGVVNSGLEGVVAAVTRLSHVDGERGELVIGGFPIDELAAHATFEETTWLLWHGELPSAQ